MMAKATQWKVDRIGELTELLSSDGIIGIVDVAGVPAQAMLEMRSTLRQDMALTMAKKTLFRRAWKEAGRQAEQLETMFESAQQPMIVHSNSLNISQLFQQLEQTRTGRAAKEGDIAPEDIVVEQGPTDFLPGPIVGELSAVGIPAKIEKGKVNIIKTVTPVKAGEVIDGELGLMLDKLEIKPIEIGIILCGVIVDGVVMPPDVLSIDTNALLTQAIANALAVAINTGISNSGTIPVLIATASAHALTLAGQLDSSALDDELVATLEAAPTVTEAAPTTDAGADEASSEEAAEEEPEEEKADFGGLGDMFG
uniref:Ribosomal protein L10 (RP-L10, rplJ) n=1 Tax=uncultured marine group II/III euryarchaeote KM3_155_E06 TaxID=1457897 RepID=A0A075GKL3_9EURY|nr:ribosomal protein L10 (RP-L10, rplJ) [uncultured marine group II/III euryarchaeote KM3_155_E06]